MYPTTPTTMRSRARPIVLLVLSVIIFGVLVLLLAKTFAGRYGYAELNFQLPDTKDLSVKVNTAPLTVRGADATYKLPDGHKTLEVTKPGYKPFSVQFDIAKGQTVVVPVVMQPVTPADAQLTTPPGGLHEALSQAISLDFTIEQVVYSSSKTWAVVVISYYGDNAAVVVHYDSPTAAWQVKLGPGTQFDSNSLNATGAPADVISYMHQQGYVIQRSS